MEETQAQSNPKLIISPPPHIRTTESIPKIMYGVALALIPALMGATYFFGWRALWLTAVSVVFCIGTEAIIQKLRKVPLTVSDGSALVTGILLAFNLPPGAPWWCAVIGAGFAIGIGKQAFGGLGLNPMNPALLGRAFLMASWPVHMTTDWTSPLNGTMSGLAGITGSTPLAAIKGAMKDLAAGVNVEQAKQTLESVGQMYKPLFWGNVGGCIGETSVILLLIGAGYLFYKGYINYRIPGAYIGSVALIAWIFGGPGYFTGDLIYHIFAGGLILGAFFMATDMVTCPSTPMGQWIFGLGCGFLTMLIRLKGGYPEGVSYAILLMNIVTPLLDRYTRPKVFGA
jgi:electron transport complex protein RnfD